MHLSKNFSVLLLNNTLRSLAGGLLSMFGVLFFYEQFGDSLTNVLLLYASLYFLFALTAHAEARLIQVFGIRNLMIIATFLMACGQLVRAVWDASPGLYFILFVLLFVLYKNIYWIPFHVEMSSFTTEHRRGSQLALMGNIGLIISMVLPTLAGLILTFFGYGLLFYIGAGTTLLSMIPLFFLEETEDVYEWNFYRFVDEFFSKRNRSIVLSNFGNGIEDAVGTIIWPIFIFIALDGEYLAIGIVTSLVFLSTLALQYAFGKLTDRVGTLRAMEYGSFLHITGWVAKIFTESFVGIYLVDTYHKLGRRLNMIPFKAAMYDEASYNRHYRDECMVLREVAFLFGKGLMAGFAIMLVTFLSVKATFIVAALAVFLMILVTKRVLIE